MLVGDPGRALLVARTLLQGPLMSNHARGLWGYTGTAEDGLPMSVLSTGTGGPSAAVVLREASRAGVRRAVRAGSAAPAAGAAVEPGALRVVELAVAHDGTSQALGHPAGAELRPDAGLTARLRAGGPAGTTVVSVDLLPGDGGPPVPDHPGAGAVDRQSAALVAAAGRLGVPLGIVLAFPGPDEDGEARDAWGATVGAAAAAALLHDAPAAAAARRDAAPAAA